MFISAQTSDTGIGYLVNLDIVASMAVDPRREKLLVGNAVIINGDVKNLQARFEDICEAIKAGDVNLYDCNEAIGYWKPAPKRAPAAAAKKAPATK